MSTEIAELGAALASAKGDNEGVQARLVSALVEKEAVRLDLKRKEAELVRLAALLDVERQRGVVAEAEIATRVEEIRRLEEELHQVKNSKAVDEATILKLHKSFADLRGEHLKLFEDFENRISLAGAPARA
ncbi:hypothetical protein GALMADRAFT_136909 [Galerina marginata CBS 339.88]|uniref:Uncharacterized protein n=1 Tax=Galerina marginata (strain CBS 339.88) TaxID=685588 RepID=A0A067TB44_GALM3|nr:hypothetical protein GALMADRAFT_136909 [Galerina marginata CBS 339.88]